MQINDFKPISSNVTSKSGQIKNDTGDQDKVEIGSHNNTRENQDLKQMLNTLNSQAIKHHKSGTRGTRGTRGGTRGTRG